MIRETTAPQDITWLKIDEVYPYECNNKIHKQPEITKIANSIKEFGWTYPILIDENNIVLAGHKRLLAAKQIGLTEVPTIRKNDLSDAQKRAYRIIDNKSSEESEFNAEATKDEIAKLLSDEFDIQSFIDISSFFEEIKEEKEEEEAPEIEFTEILGEEHNYLVLFFDNDIDWLNAQTLFDVKSVKNLSTRKDGILSPKLTHVGVGRVLNGAKALSRLIK